MEDGRTSVGLEEVDNESPFYHLSGSNNVILITTERYRKIPDPDQGYGAGAGGDGRRRLRRHHPHRQYPIDHEVPHHPRRRNGRRTDSTARRPHADRKPPASRRSTASQRSAPRASSTPCPKGSLRAAKSHTSRCWGTTFPPSSKDAVRSKRPAWASKSGAAKWSCAATSLRSSRSASANHSAGHISTAEAAELIDFLQRRLGSDDVRFHTGVSYRHLLTIRGGDKRVSTPSGRTTYPTAPSPKCCRRPPTLPPNLRRDSSAN